MPSRTSSACATTPAEGGTGCRARSKQVGVETDDRGAALDRRQIGRRARQIVLGVEAGGGELCGGEAGRRGRGRPARGAPSASRRRRCRTARDRAPIRPRRRPARPRRDRRSRRSSAVEPLGEAAMQRLPARPRRPAPASVGAHLGEQLARRLALVAAELAADQVVGLDAVGAFVDRRRCARRADAGRRRSPRYSPCRHAPGRRSRRSRRRDRCTTP